MSWVNERSKVWRKVSGFLQGSKELPSRRRDSRDRIERVTERVESDRRYYKQTGNQNGHKETSVVVPRILRVHMHEPLADDRHSNHVPCVTSQQNASFLGLASQSLHLCL